jgi:hypothetical protein
MHLLAKSKPVSQEGRILMLLKRNGNKGTPNYQLAKIALNYTMRISELRKDGYNIYAERQYHNGRWTGTWLYYLNEE